MMRVWSIVYFALNDFNQMSKFHLILEAISKEDAERAANDLGIEEIESILEVAEYEENGHVINIDQISSN